MRQITFEFIKSEFKKAQIEIYTKESGREAIDFIIKTKKGNKFEIYLQPINLDTERKVKIPKTELGEPKENLWVALALIIDNKLFNSHLIIHSFILFLKELAPPNLNLCQIFDFMNMKLGLRQIFTFHSKIVTTPDNYIFLENDVSGFPHLSNWETEGSRTPIKLVS